MKTINETTRTAYFGQQAKLVLEFRVDGIIITPDDGSVVYSLHSASTELIADTLVAAGETSVIIDSSHHVKAGTESNAPRFLRVNFTEDTVPQYVELSYTLVDFLPLTIQTQDIRALLGVSAQELPDIAMNFHATYWNLTKELKLDIFLDETKNFEANELIKYREALKQAKLLHFKALQQSKVDDHAKTRSKIDLQALIREVEGLYIEAYKVFEDSLTNEPLLQVGKARTDPITG